MSLIKKLAGETAIYGIPNILSRVLNFAIIMSYLTSTLSDSQYGYMQLMFTFAAFGMVLFTYRMETTLFRFGSKEGEGDRAFTTAASAILLSAGILVLLIIVLAKPLSSFQLGNTTLHHYFYYFAAILAFDACAAVPFAKLRLENKAKWFATLKVINIGVNIGVLLFLLEVMPALGYGYDPVYKLDLVFMANVIASLVVLILIIPTYRTKSTWVFDKPLLRKMISYTWPLAVIALAGVINQYVQFNFLLWVWPENSEIDAAQVVGRYGGAAKLAVFMTLFTTAFNYAAEPFFFKQASKSDDRSVYGKVAVAYTLVAVFVFLGVTYYMDLLQYLLRSPEYREAIGAVPILLLAYLFLGLYYNVAIWYKLSDKTKYGMYISLGGSAITIILNLLLIPVWGYYGCAIATLACYVIMVGVCHHYCQLHYPIKYPVGKILRYIILAVIFWGISVYIRPNFDGNLVATLGANTALLVLFALLIFAWDKTYLKALLK